MADELGPITYGQEDEPIFLGKEIARHKDYSEETAKAIDQAIREILDNARDSAESILKDHREELEKLADALLNRETLIDDEVRELLGFPPRLGENSLNLAVPADREGKAPPKIPVPAPEA